MSSARRSLAHQSAEQRRKMQGKMVKTAAAAAAHAATLDAAASTAADAEADASSQTKPVLILPEGLPALWGWAETGSSSVAAPSLSTAGDRACAAAVAAFMSAREMEQQFVRMHALTHAIMDAMGVQAKKGKKQQTAGASAGAGTAVPAAAGLSFELRQSLLRGLVELLCIKLHVHARTPIYAALEALDAPLEQGTEGESLLSAVVANALQRLADAPCMAHVVQFEQLASFKPTWPTMAAHAPTVLRGITRAVETVVLRVAETTIAAAAAAAAASGSSAAVTAEEQEIDEDEDDSSSSSSNQRASASASSAQWMSPSDQTRFLLRAAVGYILKYRKEVQQMFIEAQPDDLLASDAAATAATAAVPPHRAELKQLVQMMSRVLASPHVHRDVLTQCGLIVFVLQHVSCSASPAVRAGTDSVDRLMLRAIWFTYFAPPGQPIEPALLRDLPVLEWIHTASSDSTPAATAPVSVLTRSFDERLQSLARLACLRSVASHSALSVLLSPMDVSSESVDEGSDAGAPQTLLLSHLSPAVFHYCKSINPHIRAYALQTLDVLLIRIKAHISASSAASAAPAAASTGLDPATTPAVAPRDPLFPAVERMVGRVMETLYSNFDHPFKAIPGIVKAIFMQYIQLRNMIIDASVGGHDAEARNARRREYWTNFIGQILHRESAQAEEDKASDKDANAGSTTAATPASSSSSSPSSGTGFNTSSRGVFTMLVVVLPQVSVLELLRAHPALMASLFLAAQFRPLFGITTQLIETLFARAKEEGVTAPKTVGDEAAQAREAAALQQEEGASNTRSRQKQRKDAIKMRLKAKAIEAGIEATPATGTGTTTPAPAAAAAAVVYSPLYQEQMAQWRALWTPHIVAALFSSQAMWRSDIASCTLSHVLRVLDTDKDALGALLGAIQQVASTTAAAAKEGQSQQQQQDMSLRQLRALVVVLKIARRIGLISSRDLDHRIRRDGGVGFDADAAEAQGQTAHAAAPGTDADADYLPISSSQLFGALLHTDTDLRLDIFEFLCSNLQSAEPLSRLELGLVQAGLPYLLKLSVPAVRAKFVHCIQRCLIRLRDSVCREVREDLALQERLGAVGGAGAGAGAGVAAGANAADACYPPHLVGVVTSATLVRVAPSFRFFEFLERFLFDSLYPSAPFDRAAAALELYRVMVEAFMSAAPIGSAASVSAGAASESSSSTAPAELDVWNLRAVMHTRPKTLVLLNLLASNYERVRLLAFELLDRFPTPLPAFEHEGKDGAGASASSPSSSLRSLLRWSMTLCRSARMRDAEGGALALKLLFKKYVVALKWKIDYHALAREEDASGADGAVTGAAANAAADSSFKVASNAQEAILFFLESLHSFLRFQLGVLSSAAIQVRYADRNSRVHGTLLLFRLVQPELPWAYWDRCGEEVRARWRAFTAGMVATLREVAEVSLSLHIPTNAAAALRQGGAAAQGQDGAVDGAADKASTSVVMDCRGHIILPRSSGDSSSVGADGDSSSGSSSGTTTSAAGTDGFADQHGEQIVVVSSWLAVKEVSLSLGEWICTAPLPSSSSPSASPWSLSDLRSVGALFFAVLSCSKHNGVLENAHEGFLAVVATLLERHDPALSSMVADWLGHLLGLIANPWEGDSWIRRSRGIAYCLLAMLQAEPQGSKQPASEAEVRAIVEGAANTGATGGVGGEESSSGVDSVTPTSMLGRCMAQLMRMAQADTSLHTIGPVNPATGLRDQGWKLKVHGLNVLRALFRDSSLAVDALPYIAPALQIAILGFAHESWAVRNSSLITFGALLSKAVRAQVRSNVGAAGVASAAAAAAAGASAGASSESDEQALGSGGAVAKSGMTAVDFFSHYPLLHGFLLDQLVQATRGMDEDDNGATASGSEAQRRAALEQQHAAAQTGAAGSPADWTTDMHPSLYPVLLLLSRLIPSPTDESEESGSADSTAASHQLDMHAFLPFIRRCSSHPYYQARYMAAKAVVSLVPVGRLRSYVHGLVDALAEGVGARAPNHNRIHGLLLQLDSLLRFHHSDAVLLSPSDKHALGASLLPKLLSVGPEGARWMASQERMRCAPVRLLFLQVLEQCIEYVEAPAVAAAASVDSLAAHARKQLLLLAAQACDPVPVSARVADSFDGIGVDGLRAEAAAMVVRCICCLDVGAVPRGDLTALVLSLLRDSSTTSPSLALLEQLLWSLKRCFALHPRRMMAHIDMALVAQHLLEQVERFVPDFATNIRTNHTILELMFQLLRTYSQFQQQQQVGSAGASVNLNEHWSAFLTYTATSSDVAAKCAAFQCLALCIHAQLDALLSSPSTSSDSSSSLRAFLQRACTFLELLESFMDDEQPVLLRYSCVQAIQHSGLLRAHVQCSRMSLSDSEVGVTLSPMLPPPNWSSPSTAPLASLVPSLAHRSIRSVCVRLWSAPVLHLLQDENESVRVDMSTLVGHIVERADEQGSEAEEEEKQEKAAASASASDPAIGSGHTLVSRVLEQSFAYMYARYADEPLLAQSMQEMLRFYSLHFESVFDNAGSTKGSMGGAGAGAASPSNSGGAAGSASGPAPAAAAAAAPMKLFEHEKPNTVIEEVILMELAAHYLAKITVRRAQKAVEALAKTDTDAEAAASTAHSDATACVESVLSQLEWWSAGLVGAVDDVVSADAHGASGWVGGASFMEGRFVQLYGHALGVSAPMQMLASHSGIAFRTKLLPLLPSGDARLQRALDVLAQARLRERAACMHPLLQRALSSVQTLLETDGTSSLFVPIGFLTHVASAQHD